MKLINLIRKHIFIYCLITNVFLPSLLGAISLSIAFGYIFAIYFINKKYSIGFLDVQ